MSKSKKNKKVLIITYYWPPSGGAGVQRWLKFSKYLIEFGWDPVIYTPENPDVPVVDQSLLDEIPSDVTILKLPIFEPSRAISIFGGNNSTGRTGAESKSGGKKSIINEFTRWVRGNIFIPDARAMWIKPSGRFLKKWLVKNPVDAIISTGPPHSMHLIGLKVKKAFPDLIWLTDFRDPWSDMDYLAEFKMGARARKKLVKMEKEVVKNCDHILINSPSIVNSLFETLDNSKHTLIPNGWDKNDFENLTVTSSNRQIFRIGHFGALYGSRNAPGLWKAVTKWNSEQEHQIEIILVGSIGEEVRKGLKNIDCIKHLAGVNHKEAILEMMNCDALLLVQNDTDASRKCTPGKVFEYLATRKPIVSICNSPSDLATRLTDWGLPFCDHNDDATAYKMLHSIIIENGQKNVDPSPYERKALTKELSVLLDSLT